MGIYIKPSLVFTGGTVTGNTYFSANLSGATIYSGATNLYDIFLTTADGNDVTRVQPGGNITTGGTGNFPIISLVSSPSVNNFLFSGTASGSAFSANTISGGTLFSGSTDLSTIINNIAASHSGVTGNFLSLSGGTVTGQTIFNAGLSASTLSGGTIYSGSTNLYDIFLTTADGNDITRVQNGLNIYTGGTDNFPTINISAATLTSLSATTLSGGTIFSGSTNLYDIFLTTSDGNDVTRVQPGLNIYTGGTGNLPTVNISAATLTYLSANTISGLTFNVNNYIDFYTGTTQPLPIPGRMFYDNDTQGLSYFPNSATTDTFTINRQLFTRVFNSTGSVIPRGSVLKTVSATTGVQTVSLASSTGQTGNNIIGLAYNDIANETQGECILKGRMSGLTVTGVSVGQNLYLSDTIPGAFIGNTSSLGLTSRINLLGYALNTGLTQGAIFVNIVNENSEETLTIKEKNLLSYNTLSTGIYESTAISAASTTTINLPSFKGWIVYNVGAFADEAEVINVQYPGASNVALTYLTAASITYLLLNSAATLVQQTTFPTPVQRRQNIFIGKVIHPNRTTITSLSNTVDNDVSPISQLRDMFVPIKLINDGISPSPNGANLNFNTSYGTLYGLGINWAVNPEDPNDVIVTAKTAASFFYRTQTGGTSGSVTLIDPTNYDLNGVITSVGGSVNASTNQRVYLFPNGTINVQYGQQIYSTLALALAGQQTETFTKSDNVFYNAILIGLIAMRRTTTNLSDTDYAVFTPSTLFGESVGGVNGISTTTLQQAYNNSSTPEIVTSSSLGALTLQNGNGADTNNNLEIQNSAGTITAVVRGNGYLSATTVSGGIMLSGNTNLYDIFSTGGGLTVSSSTISNGTNHAILFQSGTTLYEDGSNFIWDNTNKRLAVGTVSPVSPLTVSATTTTATVVSVLANSLTTGSALSILSNTTASNNARGLFISLSGNNANASRRIIGAEIKVSNAGTTATNYGLFSVATGGTTNYGGYFYAGNIQGGDQSNQFAIITQGTGNVLLQNQLSQYHYGTALLTLSPSSIVQDNNPMTEQPTLLINGGTKDFIGSAASGFQREVCIKQTSIEGHNTTVSTTNIASLGIEGAPKGGSNTAIPNVHALLISAVASVNNGIPPTNGYGLTVNATAGATNNYAAQFIGGNTGFGLAAPTAMVHSKGAGATSATYALKVENSSATSILVVRNDGNVGVNVLSPTARLHITGGTTTVAPLKFTPGSLLSTIEVGAKEANTQGTYQTTITALNRFAEGGIIADFTSTVDNGTTVETDLYTYTTKASTLGATGEKLIAKYAGTFNDLTATSQLRVYFAGTSIGDTGALTVSAVGGWAVEVMIIRTGANTARAIVNINTPGASTAIYTSQTDLTGLTFTNTNIIKITGQAGGASGGSGDISAKLGTIFWYGQANN